MEKFQHSRVVVMLISHLLTIHRREELNSGDNRTAFSKGISKFPLGGKGAFAYLTSRFDTMVLSSLDDHRDI